MPEDETLAQQAQALLQQEADEEREIRSLRVALEQERNENAGLRGALDLLQRLDTAALTPPKWLLPRPKEEKHHATVCALITDTHWDEVVRPEEVEFLNKYDRAIAEKRLKKAFLEIATIPRRYLSGVEYDGAVLMFGGDMLSGNIHGELRETNESTVFDALVHWTELAEAGVRALAEAYARLHIVGVPGNHGRLTKQPRMKLRAKDNLDWLFYKLLARQLKNEKRITFQVAEGADASFSVYRTRYLLTHGDQFRGGSGISGALAPLLLGTHRKTRRQAAAGKPYDIMVMGHWHQPLELAAKGLIVGNALKGYDEYAYISNFEPTPASAALWLTTPEHGIGFSLPGGIVVQDRKAEGW